MKPICHIPLQLPSLDDFWHFVGCALSESDSVVSVDLDVFYLPGTLESDSVISVDLESFGPPGTLDELDDVVESC